MQPEHHPLRFLHSAESLVTTKLETIRRWPTETILSSLVPGLPGALKARADGTFLDGHHRLWVLLERGVRIDFLPREIILKE